MSLSCPTCSKLNPAYAYYCYFDGRPLSKDRQQGPLQVGSLPFPMKFYFADGHACGNFNQLALACDNRWEEARGLLGQGIWPLFFGGIGRLDLAASALQAALDPLRLLQQGARQHGSMREPGGFLQDGCRTNQSRSGATFRLAGSKA